MTNADGGDCRTQCRIRQTSGSCMNNRQKSGQSGGPAAAELDEEVVVVAVVAAAVVVAAEDYKRQHRLAGQPRSCGSSSMESPESSRPPQPVQQPHAHPDDGP